MLPVDARVVLSLCATLAATPLFAASEPGRCVEDVAALSNDVTQAVGVPRESLFIAARNDLGDRLVDLQYFSKTAGLKRGEPSLPLAVSDIRVFEFSRQGNRVDNNGNLVAVAVDLDDTPLWRIAYDCRKNTVSHLSGFGDPVQGFNTIMSGLALTVGSSEVALEVQSAFVALTDREGLGGTIQSKLGLMRAALNHYSGQDDIDEFLAYWRQFPKNLQKKLAPPAAVRSGATFTVDYFTSSTDGVEAVSLVLASDGQIRTQDRKVIYRWPIEKGKKGM
jgi:hypothetical protein